MAKTDGILATLTAILRTALGSNGAPRTPQRPRRPAARLRTSAERRQSDTDAGRARGTETVRVDAAHVPQLRVSYAPQRDGAPDAGEIVWTWVPYEEGDGRGKDRPVLVIGRASADRVYAVRMTSRAHDGDRDFVPIGSGAWDGQGRPSWVDVELLYSVHERGLRREAAVLDRERYDRVAEALRRRYGWARS